MREEAGCPYIVVAVLFQPSLSSTKDDLRQDQREGLSQCLGARSSRWRSRELLAWTSLEDSSISWRLGRLGLLLHRGTIVEEHQVGTRSSIITMPRCGTWNY